MATTGKGSTIKLVNEMEEVNDKNWVEYLKRLYEQEVPPKHPCRIM